MAISSVSGSGVGATSLAVEANEADPGEPSSVVSPFENSSFEAAPAVSAALLGTVVDDRDPSVDSGKRGIGDDSIQDGKAARPADNNTLVGGLGGGDVQAAIANLPEATKAQVTALILNPDPSIASDAQYAFGTANFANLPDDQKVKFVDLMSLTGKDGAAILAKACESATGLSTLRAHDDTTVFDNLDRMAKVPGLAAFVPGVMQDMLNPSRIVQGTAPTCTAATMQYELAYQQPAEYSRLIAGLAIDGHVTMARGQELQVQPGAAFNGSINARDQRSPTEAVFQAAVMEFANGDETYDLDRLESKRADGSTHEGLNAQQIRTALTQLFDLNYTTRYIDNDAEAASVLKTLNRANSPNRPVLIDLTQDDSPLNHCVSFEKISGNQVFLRNPQNGEVETMSVDDFVSHLAQVHPGRRRPFAQAAATCGARATFSSPDTRCLRASRT